MDYRILVWLEDIERSIDEIFEFLPEERDFFQYQKDLKTKKAIERNIEIIGEAVNRISKRSNSNITISNAYKIVSTRNRLAHEYDQISDEIIWSIIIRELPSLKEEIIKLKR
ncbi:uncharacterized protein with HEPN domain [Nonlabens dokdonensis]|jgi:uncharacterized protein with HEPN domain|uniref:DUF86 domain containing protein n=2 Tax=Nonlabens dokdonensis TaxID=328515 RepID=L7WDZ8_NONDD|nr:HepT-like ribonuclease domain-containing protein [Nonlabens dokdonensis]AGC78171.1 DUF86 domain containing protein [Nonlabens dokdonensis DSW-6]PZX37936.1 uncharacterized protein with HEPN domain [Nonlabens dokdonensis]